MFRYQAYLFFPLLLLEAVGLHVASIRALTSRESRHRPAETALLAAHVAGYLTLVLLVLSPVKAVVFMIVQQGLFGLYLGCSFAPNHKGMPVLDADDRRHPPRRAHERAVPHPDPAAGHGIGGRRPCRHSRRPIVCAGRLPSRI